jgi:ABC-2 type transport system permease protein
MFIPTFILMPLVYLGGVFYAVNSLPSIWYHISLFHPIFYLINAFRFAMIGYSEVSLLATLAVISGLVVILYGVAIYMLRNRIGVRF